MSSSPKRICLRSPRQLRSRDTRIEKLPDNVLEEVFKYLNAQELRDAALVCKNWNEVIGSAAVTMKKFKLIIDDSTIIEPISSARKHANIEMDFTCPDSLKMMINLTGLIISQARGFQFKSKRPAYMDGFTVMLCRMPLLEYMYIDGYHGYTKCPYTKVNLPKLKKIKLSGVDVEILPLINANNVTEVDFSFFHPQPVLQSASKGELVSSFLKKCKKINTLKMDQRTAVDFFTANWKDCNLKLSCFHVDLPFDITSFTASLKSFLITQAATLTDLSLNVNFALIFDENVKKVFCNEINTNLRRLSSLERLRVNYDVNDLNEIAKFNPRLKNLSVRGITTPLDAGLKMKNLEHFVGSCNADDVALKSIIDGSPKLETVEIYIHHTRDYTELVKLLLSHKEVKHLKFTCFQELTLEQIFDQISSGYGHLKSLKLRQILSDKPIKFWFPADVSEWNASEQKNKFDEYFA